MIAAREPTPSPTPEGSGDPPWRRVAIVVATALLAGAAIYLSPLRAWVDPATATDWLRSIAESPWAPAAFLVLYVLFSMTFVPVLPLAIAGTLIWGWVVGGIIELIVATIAAVPPYLVAHSAASDWIEKRLRARFGVNYDRIRIRATSTLFLARVVPILPFSVVNYAAGLAAIRPLPYVVATFAGMIPSVFIFTYLVDAVASGKLTFEQALLRVFLAGAALGSLYVLTRLVAARLYAK